MFLLELLLLTTNESDNCNNYNNNYVIIRKVIITIKMKNSCTLKQKKRLKVAIYIVHLIFYSSVKKMLFNLCLQVLRLSIVIKEFGKLFQIIGAI